MGVKTLVYCDCCKKEAEVASQYSNADGWFYVAITQKGAKNTDWRFTLCDECVPVEAFSATQKLKSFFNSLNLIK